MGTTLTSALVGVFCTILSGAVTFFLTKRKYDTEVDAQQIKNMSDSFDLYKKMSEETIHVLNDKVELLQRENSDLRQQVSQLQMQMINILGNICLDSACAKRKVNYAQMQLGENVTTTKDK